jgi:hypothetical protein
MSPVTLEKAIRAFCREACIDRRSVHNLTVAGRTMLWVTHEPQDPVLVSPPRAPAPRLGSYA